MKQKLFGSQERGFLFAPLPCHSSVCVQLMPNSALGVSDPGAAAPFLFPPPPPQTHVPYLWCCIGLRRSIRGKDGPPAAPQHSGASMYQSGLLRRCTGDLGETGERVNRDPKVNGMELPPTASLGQQSKGTEPCRAGGMVGQGICCWWDTGASHCIPFPSPAACCIPLSPNTLRAFFL